MFINKHTGTRTPQHALTFTHTHQETHIHTHSQKHLYIPTYIHTLPYKHRFTFATPPTTSQHIHEPTSSVAHIPKTKRAQLRKPFLVQAFRPGCGAAAWLGPRSRAEIRSVRPHARKRGRRGKVAAQIHAGFLALSERPGRSAEMPGRPSAASDTGALRASRSLSANIFPKSYSVILFQLLLLACVLIYLILNAHSDPKDTWKWRERCPENERSRAVQVYPASGAASRPLRAGPEARLQLRRLPRRLATPRSPLPAAWNLLRGTEKEKREKKTFGEGCYSVSCIMGAGSSIQNTGVFQGGLGNTR